MWDKKTSLMCPRAILAIMPCLLDDDDATCLRLLGSWIYIYIIYALVKVPLHNFAEMGGLPRWLMCQHSYCIVESAAKGRRCQEKHKTV